MPCVHTIEINESTQNNHDALAVRVVDQADAAVLYLFSTSSKIFCPLIVASTSDD